MKDTMLEFLEHCRQKELYCMHNDVKDVIESALNSKLLSINLKSQRLDKEKQEVKNIVEHRLNVELVLRNEAIKSSVENVVPIPSEFENFFDNERKRDVPEFSSELAHIEPTPPGIEEIDLFLATDDWMPPSIEYDDYVSEGNIYFLEELLSDDPLPILKNESSNFDHHDDSSFSCPPPKPPDVEVFFDFKPDMGVLTAKMVEDISEHHVLMPKV
uniref:Reverse transcriptase domain-containing protein n=1 Tax=Tanacetum cinerariifolium TaxID=118510 RepID=A0A6L2JJE6_TANCI|nr:hypothetical protein [Tanacetum cinerariifolium]